MSINLPQFKTNENAAVKFLCKITSFSVVLTEKFVITEISKKEELSLFFLLQFLQKRGSW